MSVDEMRKKAEEGLTASQIVLGHSYLIGKDDDGNSIPIDYDAAKHWLQLAADKGAGTALFLLGTMYDEGRGGSTDTTQAIVHYERAANRGSFFGCIHLARIYAREGSGHHSRQEALLWYDRALQIAEEDAIETAPEIGEAIRYVDAAG